jgi:hypothetical protein
MKMAYSGIPIPTVYIYCTVQVQYPGTVQYSTGTVRRLTGARALYLWVLSSYPLAKGEQDRGRFDDSLEFPPWRSD